MDRMVGDGRPAYAPAVPDQIHGRGPGDGQGNPASVRPADWDPETPRSQGYRGDRGVTEPCSARAPAVPDQGAHPEAQDVRSLLTGYLVFVPAVPDRKRDQEVVAPWR